WLALLRQLRQMHRMDEAVELAQRATRRFPLAPAVWHELAEIHHERGDADRRIRALHKILKINPDLSPAARELAHAYEQQGDLARSASVMEQTLARDPLDHLSHAFLADTYWKLGRREAAIERLKQALRLSPEFAWAWDQLAEWTRQIGRPDLPRALARALTAEQSGKPQTWLALARILDSPEE